MKINSMTRSIITLISWMKNLQLMISWLVQDRCGILNQTLSNIMIIPTQHIIWRYTIDYGAFYASIKTGVYVDK